MQEKNKKIIISSIILAVIVIIAIILIISNNKKANKAQESLQTIELSNLLEIENIEDCNYETEKTEEEISSIYISEKEKYEIKANVKAGEIEGKIIYVRETEKINMYKTEYKLNKYKDKTSEIRNIIQEFENTCQGYMQLTNESEESEMLYGESTENYERPLEESIYYEERLYSKTYKDEENEYNINIYRKDEKIICEFVKILPFSNMYSKIKM